MDEKCDTCGKCFTTKIFACRNCKIVPYCSRICREADFESHKKLCKTSEDTDWKIVAEKFGLDPLQKLPCIFDVPVLFLPGPITIAQGTNEIVPHALRHDDGSNSDTWIYKLFDLSYGEKAPYWKRLHYYVIKYRDVPRAVFGQLSERQLDEIQKMVESQSKELQAKTLKKFSPNTLSDDNPPPLEEDPNARKGSSATATNSMASLKKVV